MVAFRRKQIKNDGSIVKKTVFFVVSLCKFKGIKVEELRFLFYVERILNVFGDHFVIFVLASALL